MKSITLFCLAFFLLCVVSANGQNIQTDNVKWNASGLTDLNANVTTTNECHFITTGKQVDWVQAKGSYVNSFTVLSTSGTWPELVKFGSVVFSVKSDVLTGTITFARDNNGISIKLVLAGGTFPINILYTVTTIEKL